MLNMMDRNVLLALLQQHLVKDSEKDEELLVAFEGEQKTKPLIGFALRQCNSVTDR